MNLTVSTGNQYWYPTLRVKEELRIALVISDQSHIRESLPQVGLIGIGFKGR